MPKPQLYAPARGAPRAEGACGARVRSTGCGVRGRNPAGSPTDDGRRTTDDYRTPSL